MAARLIEKYQFTPQLEEADLIVINTCGFIQPAKEESIETILEALHRKKEGAKVVVTGCFSQRYQWELPREIPEVDLWTGVGEFGIIDKVLEKGVKTYFTNKTFLIHREPRLIFNSPYHAYVKLSEGCNQKCSFCAIPSFKGPLQSRPIKEVLEEVERLRDQGYRDLTFISQDSSSYGLDLGIKDGLIRLIEGLERIDGITGRILYLYPGTTNKRIVRAIADSSVLATYFDFPIQHISPRVLRQMGRGRSNKRLLALLELMASYPDSYIGTSIIVGHPGETIHDFQELKRFLAEFPFDRVNLFQYFDEEDTAAYRMLRKVPEEEIGRRLEELAEIVEERTRERKKRWIGRRLNGYLEGRTSDGLFYSFRPEIFAPEIDGDILINEVDLPGEGELMVGGRYSALVTQLAGEELIGILKEEVKMYRRKGDWLILKVRVQPRASRTRIVGPYEDGVKITLQAPPVEGYANQELVKFIAKGVKLPKSELELRGEKSRWKEVWIPYSPEVERRLRQFLGIEGGEG
jgi:ribosomal protein S12 methylthiotransferase RimO